MRCTAAERAAPPISTMRRGVTPEASSGATASARPQSMPSTEARTRWRRRRVVPGQAVQQPGRVGQRGGALAVEERQQHQALGVLDREGEPVEVGRARRRPSAAPRRSPGRRSGCTPAAGSGRSRRRSPATMPDGSAAGRSDDREHGAAGAERDHHVAGLEVEAERGAHVVAGAGRQHDAVGRLADRLAGTRRPAGTARSRPNAVRSRSGR